MKDKLEMTIDRLKSEILAEIQLLGEFSSYIEKVKSDIQAKDWINLEQKLKQMNIVSGKIEDLEQIRHNTFNALKKQLGLPGQATLRRVVTRLDFRLRSGLEDIHQQLKIKVLKVKIEYQNLGYYLQNISGFIYKFLEEVFPHTKGRIYSRQGKAAAVSPDSIMINKEL